MAMIIFASFINFEKKIFLFSKTNPTSEGLETKIKKAQILISLIQLIKTMFLPFSCDRFKNMFPNILF